eukprot:gene9128-1217_t
MFDELPDDSVFEIANYLDPTSIISLSETSERNNRVLRSDLLWQNLCKNHWKSTNRDSEKKNFFETVIESSEEFTNEEVIPLTENYFALFKKRQYKYNKWKKNLVTRKWLITDYIRLLWWLFIDPQVQPEYLPKYEAETIQKNSLYAGRLMIAFFIFFPLVITSLAHFLWAIFFIPIFLIMAFFSLAMVRIDYTSWKGIFYIFGLLIGTGVVAASFYTNDLFLVIAMLFSASITLATAHSMNSMIMNLDEVDEYPSSFNGYPVIFLTALSIIIGGIIGAMGVRGTIFFFILIFGLLGGELSGEILELMGVKGVIMLRLFALEIITNRKK